MGVGAALVEILGLQPGREVARAQISAMRHRAPFLYGIVAVNVVALAFTHQSANPLWQAVLLPGVILAIGLVRMVAWIRMRPDRMTDRQIARLRWRTAVLAVANALMILFWALTLNQALEQPRIGAAMTATAHAVVFCSITLVVCIFLLMHLRLAAIAVGVSVVILLAGYLFSLDRVIETAIGLNVLVVGVTVLCVAVSTSRHFDRSVIASADLMRLSAINARLAAADVLTELPNRRAFFTELANAAAGSEPYAVIVCDLDGFKQINDVYGHQAGDELLRQVANRFVAAAPEASCVARMGGDEFTFLLLGTHSNAAQFVAERVIASCCEPIRLDVVTAHVGATAGICFSWNVLSGEPAKVYERADYALFEGKKSGRGRVEVFSGAHDTALRRQSTIARLLQTADFRTELAPVFQPIVDARTFEIRGFEALIRWTSPELGPVDPQEFIPIAERTDLILEISRLVLRSALAQAFVWPDHILLKVNLSVRDLMNAGQTERLLAELHGSGVPPSRVTFEITETILAESLEQVRSNVDRLRDAGCRIAIDDFGVGYSSLNYIHVFAPDVIKIDRCFIRGIAESETASRVVRTMIELARNVGAVSVAEGVETAAEVRILADLGCDELQGFFFSKPVCARTTLAMARRATVLLDAEPMPMEAASA